MRAPKRPGRMVLAGLLAMIAGLAGTLAAARDDGWNGLRITIAFNNVPSAPGLETAWGFAAVVQGLERTLLFDTGGDGALLLGNLGRLGIEPGEIDGLFLSHAHGDHTRGLGPFLGRNPNVVVYMPASFPTELKRIVGRAGARLVPVSGPMRLFERAYSTGPLRGVPEEQALLLETPDGLVIVTGCAHPGIADVVRAAKRQRGESVRLVVGGFHLLRQPEARIRATIDALKGLGVAQVAPSHCSGDRAIALFREAWGEDFLDGGCGAVIGGLPVPGVGATRR